MKEKERKTKKGKGGMKKRKGGGKSPNVRLEPALYSRCHYCGTVKFQPQGGVARIIIYRKSQFSLCDCGSAKKCKSQSKHEGRRIGGEKKGN